LVPHARRIGPQIDDEAGDTESESGKRIFQRDDRSRSEQAQGRDRPEMHDPASSSTKPARLLAIFVVDTTDQELVIPDK
jgi:hypothetical protein